MKSIFLISSLISLMFLSGCSGVSGSVGDTAPKCNDVVVDGKVVRNCKG